MSEKNAHKTSQDKNTEFILETKISVTGLDLQEQSILRIWLTFTGDFPGDLVNPFAVSNFQTLSSILFANSQSK